MRRDRIGWLAIASPAVLVGGFEYLRHRWLEHPLPGVWGNVVGAGLVAAGVYGFIRYFMGAVARTEQELGRSRAEAAVLAERQRIAREMHDRVAQALFHLRVRLREVDGQVARGAYAGARREVAGLQGQLGAAYHEVRSVISDLKREGASEDMGEALRRGAVRVAQELGFDLRLNLMALPHLDAQGQQHLLAIVSEAMTNAVRHGGATRISLSAEAGRLTIADNGRGFDRGQVKGDGFGLLIMAERARMLGGDLEIHSEPGRGARITVDWEAVGDAPARPDR